MLVIYSLAAQEQYAQGFALLCQQRHFACTALSAQANFQGALQPADADDAASPRNFQYSVPFLQRGLVKHDLSFYRKIAGVLELAEATSSIFLPPRSAGQ